MVRQSDKRGPFGSAGSDDVHVCGYLKKNMAFHCGFAVCPQANRFFRSPVLDVLEKSFQGDVAVDVVQPFLLMRLFHFSSGF